MDSKQERAPYSPQSQQPSATWDFSLFKGDDEPKTFLPAPCDRSSQNDYYTDIQSFPSYTQTLEFVQQGHQLSSGTTFPYPHCDINPEIKKPTAAEQLHPSINETSDYLFSKRKSILVLLGNRLNMMETDFGQKHPMTVINDEGQYTADELYRLVTVSMQHIWPCCPILDCRELLQETRNYQNDFSTMGSIIVLSLAALGESILQMGDLGVAKSNQSHKHVQTLKPQDGRQLIIFEILSMMFSLRQYDSQGAQQALHRACKGVELLIMEHRDILARHNAAGYPMEAKYSFIVIAFWVCRMYEIDLNSQEGGNSLLAHWEEYAPLRFSAAIYGVWFVNARLHKLGLLLERAVSRLDFRDNDYEFTLCRLLQEFNAQSTLYVSRFNHESFTGKIFEAKISCMKEIAPRQLLWDILDCQDENFQVPDILRLQSHITTAIIMLARGMNKIHRLDESINPLYLLYRFFIDGMMLYLASRHPLLRYITDLDLSNYLNSGALKSLLQPLLPKFESCKSAAMAKETALLKACIGVLETECYPVV